MTTPRSELGISPVLLQAIAQTLTASTTVTSTKDSVGESTSQIPVTDTSSSVRLHRQSISDMEINSGVKDTNRVVSQLLQKLNEPVASLLTQTSTSQILSSAFNESLPHSAQSNITQAGLSMLGIHAEEDSGRLSQNGSSVYVSRSQTMSRQHQTQPTMSISGEELNNFLMKQEPIEEDALSPIQSSSLLVSSQSMNRDVSSVLSALASQHAQKSLSKRSDLNSQNQRSKESVKSPSTVCSSAISSASAETPRTQPQIIIYGLQCNNGLEVPVPLPEGSDVIVNESAGGAGDAPTAYRVLLQSSKDGNLQEKALSSPSSLSYSLSVGGCMQPISDVQNSQEGMNQPCPVCGDKVSGYHYGIFTCESCKGFFKRTVQNKKSFICPKFAECSINSMNRKKCPACRFKRCLQMGMKLEAIRQDRTRGGRSSYEGCGSHLKNRSPNMLKKIKKSSLLAEMNSPGPSQSIDDGSKSHRNLVAILNHNLHKQTTPHTDSPPIPELLRDIMNLETLLSDDDIPVDSIMESPFQDQALYAYMMQLAEVRLYKLVRWARNLPQFGAISTDDQILLLQNCWSELMALSLCWRSIETPQQISISSTHHITTEWAQHLGCEDVVVRLMSVTDCFRKLYMDQYEYVALKVLLLISPDVKGLKEPRKIRDFQDKIMEALLSYTSSHYKNMRNKFGELLLRLPELSRLSFMGKNILLKYLPTCTTSCGLLVELLKGDSRTEQDACVMGL